MIETRNLGKTYHAHPWIRSARGRRRSSVEALREVTLRIERGEVFGLMGPNGAGKTTLLRVLATLVPPSTGGACICGADLVREAATVRRFVGLASGDERGFYGSLNGHENLEFFAALLGLSPRVARRLADKALEAVDLLPVAGRPVGQYSTGMRQRLGIARALLGAPPVLLLDEPTRSLDPIAASEVQALVRRLAEEAGMTVVVATHNFHEAEGICQRVAVLADGAVRDVVPVRGGEHGLAPRYRASLMASR